MWPKKKVKGKRLRAAVKIRKETPNPCENSPKQVNEGSLHDQSNPLSSGNEVAILIAGHADVDQARDVDR